MKTAALTLALLASLAGVSNSQAQGLEQAAWLAGCWALEGAEPGSMEQWTPPAGGAMLGLARTLKNGRMGSYEFLQIREMAGARMAYVARPSGQAEVRFPLLRAAEGELVFENLGHDFPQRISYQRQVDGRLLARIEGRRPGGEQRVVDFPLRRADCSTLPGGPAPQRVQGSFEVKMAPQPGGESGAPGRMLLDKRFSGALEGTSQGQMLALSTATKGSAGYVAMELFTGTLAGRRGSFVLQHSGTMTRGTPSLTVSVLPDSGSGELQGLSGTMGIRIESGKHFYDFEYSLPSQP
jgi:hypothetical protein